MGVSRAKDIILSGRQVNAEEALSIGLVNRLAPAETVQQDAIDWAVEFATGPLAAHGLAKLAINEGIEAPLINGLLIEQDRFVDVFATEDSKIGVASFLENGPGKAEFVGR